MTGSRTLTIPCPQTVVDRASVGYRAKHLERGVGEQAQAGNRLAEVNGRGESLVEGFHLTAIQDTSNQNTEIRNQNYEPGETKRKPTMKLKSTGTNP